MKQVTTVRFATLAFALASMVWGNGPRAETSLVNLNPSADAYVAAYNPTGNFGGAGALAIAGSGTAKGAFEAVLRFDTATAKATFDSTYGVGQWTIDAVTLRLSAASPGNPTFNSSAAGQFSISYMQNDSWVEGTGTPSSPRSTGITWSALPSFLSASNTLLGTFSFNGATGGQFAYNLDLAPALKADMEGGNLVGLHLTPVESTLAALFNSRSGGGGSAHPVLTISAIPEPTPLALLAIAAAAMLWRRAR